jgi:hypothetical protein
MKTWYKAVCDKCGEATDIFVSNPSCTEHYLSENDIAIQAWLEKHYSCELRLIWRDLQLDKLWEEGYVRDVLPDGLKILKRKNDFKSYKNCC